MPVKTRRQAAAAAAMGRAGSGSPPPAPSRPATKTRNPKTRNPKARSPKTRSPKARSPKTKKAGSAVLPRARVSAGSLRRALSARRKRAAEALRRRALSRARRKAAGALVGRLRARVADVVVPASLRSRRDWTLREWSEHRDSSPPEIQRVQMLRFPNLKQAFKREMVAALRGKGAAASGTPPPPPPAGDAEAKRDLRRAYGVEVAANGKLRGKHGPLAQEAVEAAGPEAGRLSPKALGAAVDRALAKVDARVGELQRRGYTVWDPKQQRRQSAGAGTLAGGEFVTVAAGRRSRRVVGRSLLPYRLPEDLMAWLQGPLGVRYNPALNPRLRQRVRGLGTRPRFVWGFNRALGLDKARYFVGLLVRAAAAKPGLVSARRNWAALHPAVLDLRVSRPTDPAPSAVQVLADVVARLARDRASATAGGAATAVYANFQTAGGVGHANVLLVGLRRDPADAKQRQLLLRVLDPFAHDGLFTPATRAVLTDAAARAAPRARVQLEVCDFQTARQRRAMRVQYGREGVCGPSSFALLMSALRQIRSPHRLWQPRFCERAYGGVRIQDAVLVMQVAHRIA